MISLDIFYMLLFGNGDRYLKQFANIGEFGRNSAMFVFIRTAVEL